MVFNLDAVGLERQAQSHRASGRVEPLGAFHHAATHRLPVHLRPGREVGVVIAHGAIHLGHQLDLCNALARRVQAHHHVGDFLAHRGGTGGLAMGAAEHGHIGIGMRHGAQARNHGIQAGQQDLLAGGLQLQSVAGVVDVFAGAGKVHELIGCRQLFAQCGCECRRRKLRLDPILDGFDIVVGGFLNFLDGQSIIGGKVAHQAQQIRACGLAQGLEFLQAGIAQGNEPANFHLNTTVHIALLAHEGTQGA